MIEITRRTRTVLLTALLALAVATVAPLGAAATPTPNADESAVGNDEITQALLDWQAGEIDNDMITDVALAWQNDWTDAEVVAAWEDGTISNDSVRYILSL
jgi:hypothetical protein